MESITQSPPAMTAEQRYESFDGDFRRPPKTDTFCCVCQKDIKPEAVKFYVYLGNEPCLIIHPEDIDGTELKMPIGTDCAKKIAPEFLVAAESKSNIDPSVSAQ